MKKKVFKIEDMPDEVMWVFCLPEYIGSETAMKMDEIKRRYPDWFPWEAKYDSIPQEVHEAYGKELEEFWMKGFDSSAPSRGGLLEELKIQPMPDPATVPSEYTLEDFTTFIDGIEKDKLEREKERKKQHRKDKKLWDKHYSKYGLEYPKK